MKGTDGRRNKRREKKTARINVAVTERKLNVYHDAAAKERLYLSEWARETLDRAAATALGGTDGRKKSNNDS